MKSWVAWTFVCITSLAAEDLGGIHASLSTAHLSRPWDGAWKRLSYHHPQFYNASQCGADNRQWCTDDVKRQIVEWQWFVDTSTAPPLFPPAPTPARPSRLHHLPDFSADKFLRWLERDQRAVARGSRQKVLFIGDSLIRNIADSLRCLLPEHKRDLVEYRPDMHFCRTISNNNVFPSEVPDLNMDRKFSLVVFGAANWFFSDNMGLHCHDTFGRQCERKTAYVNCINMVVRKLKQMDAERAALQNSQVFTHYVWLSVPPKHFLCAGVPLSCFSCQIPRPAIPSTFPWSSSDTKEWREYETPLRNLGEKSWFTFLDIYRMSEYRYDAHPGGNDCNHWCLPGVPDTWNALLLYILEEKSKKY